jgi:hypothetical protein
MRTVLSALLLALGLTLACTGCASGGPGGLAGCRAFGVRAIQRHAVVHAMPPA